MNRQDMKNKTFRIARWLGEDRMVWGRNEKIDPMTHYSEQADPEGTRVWPRYEFDPAAFGRLMMALPEGSEVQIGGGSLPIHYVKGPAHGKGDHELYPGEDIRKALVNAVVMLIEKGYKPRGR